MSRSAECRVDDPFGILRGDQACHLIEKNWYVVEAHCVSLISTLVVVTVAVGLSEWLNLEVVSFMGLAASQISAAMILPHL